MVLAAARSSFLPANAQQKLINELKQG